MELQLRPSSIFLCFPLLIVTTTSCGSDDGDPRSRLAVERDSAGIHIVESTEPVWKEGEEWSLSLQVQIGTPSGRESTQLFQVGDVARLSDGRIAVVNSGSHELRVYSEAGEHIRTIGREGEGPGEFMLPRSVWILPSDSLMVMDWTRISVFDSAGVFAGSSVYGTGTVVDRYVDGSLLKLVIPPGVDMYEVGYSRPGRALVRLSADGAVTDTLAHVTGDEFYRFLTSAGGIASFNAPFGLVRTAVTHGSATYTGDGARFEVQVLDENGALARIIRRSGDPRAVDEAAIAGLEERMLMRTTTEEQERSRRQLFAEWTYPATQPAYDRLLIDSEGNLWVQHWDVETEATSWSVFSDAGHWLGIIEMPSRFRVTEIGSDYALGVLTDDLGVEYVHLYSLEK